MPLLIVSGNAHKVAQIGHVLEQQVKQIDIDLPEVQAMDVREIIEAKARAAFQQTGQPVIVEDAGLSFHAWNGLPGALIRWFLESVGNDGLCKMLSSFDDRRAIAQSCIGYFDGEEFVSFSGQVDGEIALSPRGQFGFGWDAIFQPDGSSKTFGEMDSAAGDETFNMRLIAARQLKHYLDQRGV